MKVGVDNAILWVSVAHKERIQIVGSEDSAILRMVGVIERKKKRGTVVSIRKIHVPLEFRGRVALAVNRRVEVGTSLWVIGCHEEDTYVDRYGDEQHKLKILVHAFETNRTIDLKNLLGGGED